MKLKYTYTLLTLVFALCFVPAVAQTKHTTKKTTSKTQTKKPAPKKAAAKPATKPAAKSKAPAPKTEAKNLGEAASKTSTDAIKKEDATNNPQDKTPGRLSEEIVVTTAYKPVLADAVKIRRNPEMEDKIPFKAPLTYSGLLDKKLEKNEDIKQLNAMKIPVEKDSALMPNYVKVGLGNLKTTYGEAYITNGRDEALQIGGYLKHFAQAGTLYKQNQSKDEIGVFGKSITDQNTLSGRIDYSYNTNYFYGYDMSGPMPINFNPGKQHFSTFGAEGEIAKNYKDVENDFTYAAKIKGYAYSDAYHARETNVVLSGFVNQTINQFYAGVSGSADFSAQNDSLYSYNNSLLRINPYLKFQGDAYKVDAGINMVDEFGFTSNFYIFPAAKAELQVIPKYVRLFVEAKGDVNKTSMRDLLEQNPFLGPNIAIKNSVDKLDISAGLKGTLAPALSFKADIYRNSIRDMPLFVSNFSATGNKFAVIYDTGNSRVNGFNGELDFKPSTDLDIFGRVEFKNYQMATEAQAWNLPKFKMTAGTSIQITDKVKITGTLLIRGAAYSRDVNVTIPQVNINSFADLSGSVDYKINKRIFIFGKVNNILNTSNQTYLYYPDYGFNIFGGAGLNF
jgi:hypothetical protein